MRKRDTRHLGRDRRADAADRVRTRAQGAAAPEASARYRITIAEDDEKFLLLLQYFIAQAFPHAGIDTFPNAEDALGHILNTGTDILITDDRMAAMSGTDLIRELRSRGLTIPIVMVSGNLEGQPGALLAGATEFLDKSVSFTGIADRLRQLLPARSGCASSLGQ